MLTPISIDAILFYAPLELFNHLIDSLLYQYIPVDYLIGINFRITIYPWTIFVMFSSLPL
jgi:hypothetical protein